MEEIEFDKDYWLKKLHAYQEELITLDEESSESRKPVELDQTSVGRLSRMDALQGQAMNNAIAQRRKQTLHKIDVALGRLEEDEFGFCIACGDEIALRRLELDPTAALCTGCAKG